MNDVIDHLKTRTGFRFDVRPVSANDGAIAEEFFTHVTQADLRFRFLTGINKVGHDRIQALTLVDHELTENFLAFAEGETEMITTGMLACDAALDTGEVAIVIRDDYKHRGISWELLTYIAQCADQKGVKTLQSIESRDNHAAIELEREMDFSAGEFPGDATVVLLTRKAGATDVHRWPSGSPAPPPRSSKVRRRPVDRVAASIPRS